MPGVYRVNPAAVSVLWTTQNKPFHGSLGEDILLMQNDVALSARNAAYKAPKSWF